MNFFEKLFEKLLRKKEVERVFILEGKELPLIKEKLKALGFKKKLNATQVSRYFDFDDSRLFKAQQYLRIRAISDKYKYTTSVEFALNIRRIDANKSEVRDQFKLNLTIGG